MQKQVTPQFTLQWHITADCNYNCKHCYMTEEDTFRDEKDNALSLSHCKDLLDDFVDFTTGLSKRFAKKIDPFINFTGGDPLLRNDFFDILAYAKKLGISFGILGNPNLIDSGSASKLKDYGITKYQISLDGTETTHDQFRAKGSFKKSIDALQTLKTAGIRTHVMSSVSKENYKDILKLMSVLIDSGCADKYAFARVSSVGNGQELNNDFSPNEYRDFLLSVHNFYEKKKEQNKNIMALALKDNLWTLLRYELGLFKPDEHTTQIKGGCGVGIHFLTVLADGLVYACRRFPSPVGRVPLQKLNDIFLGSKELNYYRQHHLFEGCKVCPLLKYCRGCPAISYKGKREDFFKLDPQCWRFQDN